MRHLAAIALACLGCSDLELHAPDKLVHARFDPDARVIPMPSDVLRDATAGHLALPDKTPAELAKLTDAEREFYAYLDTLDGWSSLMSATVDFTGAIDPATIDASTIELWHWGAVPERVVDVRVSLAPDATRLQIDPPRTGWQRGERYVAVVRGGDHGVRGRAGEPVECDAAFYFLRLTERLDTAAHERAFPGATHDERAENARKLEAIREDLSPMFDFFATARSLPRRDVAALWAFTVTTRTELAMDQPSQRIPLPIELMIDPATGHVDAPAAPWDSPAEVEAKGRLAELDGFALTGSQLFELTGPVDPATITEASVRLFELSGAAPAPVPVSIELLADRAHLAVTPKSGRLAEATTYALVVGDTVRDAAGRPPTVMPIGHFLRARAPLVVAGKSQVGAVADRDAARLERARGELAPALDALGRDHVLAAWPFTTMTMAQPLADTRRLAERLATSPDPANLVHMTPGQALADFPFGIGSIANVGDVYHGTIQSPNFLDPVTRQWRRDGGHELEDVRFTMTIPKHPPAQLPVVIFGHGLVTERRFVLALGDALAAKGFAAIAIDFPYHGARTYCARGGPISVVDPLNGALVSLDPCAAGSTCDDHGRCVDGSGTGNHLATWGVIDTPIASGAVFLEIDHIANSKDHFRQALVDLGALDRALRTGAWQAAIGVSIDATKIYYAGQSLGGIMGAVFLGTAPDVPRAVLNVPGAGMVETFDKSTFFRSQMDAFFTRQHVDRASFDGHRFLTVAHWFMDAIDPQHVGAITGNRALMLQMATLDAIIPNSQTQLLQAVTGAPRRDYLAEHGFLVIPIEPEYLRGTRELASFLSGELQP